MSTSMNLTREYGLTHQAVREIAAERSMARINVRVVVALYDCGGRSRSNEIEAVMRIDGSQIRRAIADLRPRFLTGGDKRGMRLPIALTDEGYAIAGAVQVRRRELADMITERAGR